MMILGISLCESEKADLKYCFLLKKSSDKYYINVEENEQKLFEEKFNSHHVLYNTNNEHRSEELHCGFPKTL